MPRRGGVRVQKTKKNRARRRLMGFRFFLYHVIRMNATSHLFSRLFSHTNKYLQFMTGTPSTKHRRRQHQRRLIVVLHLCTLKKVTYLPVEP